METVKCQGKIREKSGNFEVDDKLQPWCILTYCNISFSFFFFFFFFFLGGGGGGSFYI